MNKKKKKKKKRNKRKVEGTRRGAARPILGRGLEFAATSVSRRRSLGFLSIWPQIRLYTPVIEILAAYLLAEVFANQREGREEGEVEE